MKITTKLVTASALCLAVVAGPLAAQDASPSAGFYNALKGKKIGFVPIAMGFNETQAWRIAMERQGAALGYEVIVRDPNWSTALPNHRSPAPGCGLGILSRTTPVVPSIRYTDPIAPTPSPGPVTYPSTTSSRPENSDPR